MNDQVTPTTAPPRSRYGPTPKPAHLRSRPITTTLPGPVHEWLASLDPSTDREKPSVSAGLRVIAMAAYMSRTKRRA